MNEAIQFLAPPFVMCLVIASLTVYLGMHVLAREVIFVDLSLAQLAALGATVAAIFGAEDEGYAAPLTAFGFTVGGAVIFAFTRRVRRHVSQEAIVGITYAVASAVTVLALANSPHGAEHLKDILVGSLLLTEWSRVWQTALAFTALGVLQLVLARRFIRLSWQPDEAERTGKLVDLWDFVFYLLFGIVITLSVRVAGILLVFSFLIVPAVITRLFSDSILKRLIAGWAVAVLASCVGLAGSWHWDLPTGATIVTAFGLLLIVAGVVRGFIGLTRRAPSASAATAAPET